MTRDHSTAAWTPDWLGEHPGPAHAAPDNDQSDDSSPDNNDETRELIDLDAEELHYEEPPGQLRKEPWDGLLVEPQPSPTSGRLEPRRPLVSEGWAEERSRPGGDPSVGSLRSLSAVAVTGRRPVRPPAAPRPYQLGARTGSASALVALVLLALVSAFFAWVSAEPLWLAVGHSQSGAVTVTKCDGDRCLGTFTGGGFTRDAVPVMGDAPKPGQSTPARMTSARGARAYVDIDATSRAAVGVALILLCGLVIARATGVRRLPTRPARRTAALLSLLGPLVLLAAMLGVTY